MRQTLRRNRLEAIIFDLGNVIVGFDHRIAARKIAKYARKNQEEIYRLFFDSSLTQAFDKGEISALEFFLEVRDKLNLEAMSFEEFVSIWNGTLWEIVEVTRLIRELKKGYKILILSNTNKLHFNYIKDNFEIISQADKIILSYEVGMMKPDPRIYEVAIRESGTSVERIVYVEDRVEFIEAAKRAGLTTVHFKEADQLRKDFTNLGIALR